MLRLIGLQQRLARRFRAPRTARDLPHQLERPLGGAQVRALQPKVCINDPDQRQQRKVMPLRHQLRTDDDIRPALGDFCDMGLHRAC